MRFELINLTTGEIVRGKDGELNTFSEAYKAYQFEMRKLYGDDDPFEIKFVGH